MVREMLYREMIAVCCENNNGQNRAFSLPLHYLARRMIGTEISRGVSGIEVTNRRTVEV